MRKAAEEKIKVLEERLKHYEAEPNTMFEEAKPKVPLPVPPHACRLHATPSAPRSRRLRRSVCALQLARDGLHTLPRTSSSLHGAETARAGCQPQLVEALDAAEAELSGENREGPLLCGKEYTLADCVFTAVLARLHWAAPLQARSPLPARRAEPLCAAQASSCVTRHSPRDSATSRIGTQVLWVLLAAAHPMAV